jgi:hypothetical protein
MDWKTKTGIVGAVVLVIAVLIFIIKVQYDAIERLKFIETSMVESKKLSEGVVRAQSSYVTKADLERLIKDQKLDLAEIKKDLRKLGADVVAIETVKVVTPGFSGNNIPTTTTTPNPNPPQPGQPVVDQFGYLQATQWLTLTEPFGDGTVVTFGKAGFSAWQQNPWSLEVLPREYSSVTVLGQNEDGRHYAYSRFEITVDGETHTIPITDAKIVEEYPNPEFHFNPRLYLGVDGGLIANPPAHAEVTPNIGLSFFSYGKIKTSPTWSFLTVGVGYATQTQTPVLIVAPVNYNIAKHIPFMDNLHLGPSVSVDVDANVGLYFGGRVGF